jgi:hypothetical protein
MDLVLNGESRSMKSDWELVSEEEKSERLKNRVKEFFDEDRFS